MNKKVMLSLAAAAMVGTLAVGGTLAWFTDTETATNIVTTGKVDIKLDEYGGKDGVIKDGGLTYDDVMPGDTFQKTVTIKNMENDAYVRANIIVSGSETVLSAFGDENLENDITFEGLGDDVKWTKNEEDGSYFTTVYYDGIMKASDGNPWTVFSNIIIPGKGWDNAFADEEFNIKVVAEAIQSSNFANEDDAWEAAGTSVADIPDGKGDATGTNSVETPTSESPESAE